jgi:hypothetical protein
VRSARDITAEHFLDAFGGLGDGDGGELDLDTHLARLAQVVFSERWRGWDAPVRWLGLILI